MRQPLPLATALLIGSLACQTAEAQSWVDPPARAAGEAAKPLKEAPPAPVAPEAPAQAAAAPKAIDPLPELPPAPSATVTAAPSAPIPRARAAESDHRSRERLPERTPERRHAEQPAQAAPARKAAEAAVPAPGPAPGPALGPALGPTAGPAGRPAPPPVIVPAQPPAPPLHAIIRPPAASPIISWFRMKRWAAKSHAFVSDYLDLVSAPGDTMVAAVPQLYAESVVFHGRTLSQRAVMADKRRFARRWPVRRYEMQARQTQAACSVGLAVCQVRTVFDFHAENPASGARSQGVSELVLDVSFAGDRPVIVSETSRVLRRSGSVSGLVTPRQGA